ncbi:decaprenyl-phosphate phosphoribosyltransferase [Methylococcaceae bacterium WWC4]|nr:decaprenyl-phosphate phosphoribosyltransferase [Methylococcaceae bacterium WWC4]OHX35346.1 prenyltransferase [Methylomonas sp. LWB]
MMTQLILLLRPHQYVKNSFVLLGVVFSHQWDNATLILAALAFFAFCCMASAVYVLNDILDVEEDRQHPKKRYRPIANGTIAVPTAWGLFSILTAASILLGIGAGKLMPVMLSIYLVLNLAYSLRLKHVVILDVFVISTGFMLRILGGTLGLGIAPSHWLLLCGLMLTLFLGFAKRRAELLMLESFGEYSRATTRRVLDDYSPIMLEQYIAVSAACTILSYGLYTVSDSTIALHGSDKLVYTVPFVVYGIFRYLFLLHHRQQGNDTAKDLLTDRHLLFTVLGWFVTCVVALI